MRHHGQRFSTYSARGESRTCDPMRGDSEHNSGTDEAADKCVKIEGVIRTLPPLYLRRLITVAQKRLDSLSR
jgi:hypothetical protein